MLLSKLFKKKDNTPHCAVVIVAAGSSLRMGGDKLMMELCHVPVLARTLLAFQQSPLVDEIIVVTRMEKIMDTSFNMISDIACKINDKLLNFRSIFPLLSERRVHRRVSTRIY